MPRNKICGTWFIRNVYNHLIFQLIHGLFQIPALSKLPRVRIVLQQTPKRSRGGLAQKRVKQGLKDERLQVFAILSCDQGIAGILWNMEDSWAQNKNGLLILQYWQVTKKKKENLKFLISMDVDFSDL